NRAMIQIEITNNSKKEILIPDLLYWGILNDPVADLILEIQRQNDQNEFSSYEIPDNYHPSFEPMSLTKLPPDGIRRDTVDVSFFFSYNIPKGNYRVKVLYKISNHNKFENDVPSNWAKFSIE
ncbi:MAG TPA: hypothetical protein VIY47_05930, partial [Ignavibacteriaceae bacterium]